MCVFFSIDPALHQITITKAVVYLGRLLLSPHIMQSIGPFSTTQITVSAPLLMSASTNVQKFHASREWYSQLNLGRGRCGESQKQEKTKTLLVWYICRYLRCFEQINCNNIYSRLISESRYSDWFKTFLRGVDRPNEDRWKVKEKTNKVWQTGWWASVRKPALWFIIILHTCSSLICRINQIN